MADVPCSNLRKIKILLDELEKAGKRVDYYALDLMESELQRTLADVPNYKHVRCFGLLGTYDDGFDWLKRPEIKDTPKLVLSLGSSIGNFNRSDAAEFVRAIASTLEPHDRLLIALDGCQDGEKVYHAYNDREG